MRNELHGNVLITGGAGFIGRALLRRAQQEEWQADFTVLSRDDAKHAALQRRFPEVRCVLGDVAGLDFDAMTRLFTGFDVVIHAAASKYVDRAETAPADTVRTNIDGSARVLNAALSARVERLVALSTDKACAPTSTYGLTKAVMERLYQGAPAGITGVTVVRYGNVVGSTGSVLPMFMQFAAQGMPIMLTDPLMTRFWMSADEAIDAILFAVLDASHGELVVPRMKALDMANVVRMALGYDDMGALPDQDLPLPERRVVVRGPRPGEKRHEALVHEYEALRTVHRDAYMVLAPPGSAPSSEPYTVVSNDPPGGWMGLAEMRLIVEDAATI